MNLCNQEIRHSFFQENIPNYKGKNSDILTIINELAAIVILNIASLNKCTIDIQITIYNYS